jgi:hypothetical protein
MKTSKLLCLKFLSILLLCGIISGLALPGQSGLAAGNANSPQEISNALPGDIGWRSGFFNNGVNVFGYAYTVEINGGKVYVGGKFDVAGNNPASNIAMWDGAAWHDLAGGMNGPVYALASDGRGRLYAGGGFTTAGGISAQNIARWDGQKWEALGDGATSYVRSIAIDSTANVYAAGFFAIAGGNSAQGIARWDGTSWHSLGDFNPASGAVYVVAIDRYGFVYAGGNFKFSSGSIPNYLARWDGTTWSGLGTGISGAAASTNVSALAMDSRGNLFAGGIFTSAGGQNVTNLARWNGENWSPVGENSGGLFTDNVRTLFADGGELYASGTLIAPPGVTKPESKILKWDGLSWHDLNPDGNNLFLHFAMDRDGNLFAAGNFNLIGGLHANGVVKWNGSGWSKLGEDKSVDNPIFAMASDRIGGVYVGGSFTTAAGLLVNNVAHFDGTSWNRMGDGLSGSTTGANVSALAVDHQGILYAGGGFTQSGEKGINRVAKWTGSAWEGLGDGVNDYVTSLAVDSKDNLYIAGDFTQAGNKPVGYIAKWTGAEWETLGGGVNFPVYALAIDDQDRLYTGGYFSTAGGITVHGLARWDGSQWEDLSPSGYYYFSPMALLYNQGTLYILQGNILALRNGSFEPVGNGFGSSDNNRKPFATCMAIDNQGNLIAGGNFDLAGGTPANSIARWNGTSWENLGSGVNGYVSALAPGNGGRMYFGGNFDQAGGKVSAFFAQWDETFYQWLPLAGNH